MEHTYLLRPGRWRAEGTYYDDAGRAFPLTGRSELIQDGPERCQEGRMGLAAKNRQNWYRWIEPPFQRAYNTIQVSLSRYRRDSIVTGV